MKRLVSKFGIRFAAAGATVALAALAVCQGCQEGRAGPEPPNAPHPVQLSLPDFPPMPVPAGNPTTREGIVLGRRLFYDPILSGDSSQSCASCHAQAFAFTDHGSRFSIGISGHIGTLTAPVLSNAGWLTSDFWNGRAATLEDQALAPVMNPLEMNQPWSGAVAKLKAHREYPALFQAAFPDAPLDSQHVVMALAQFERTFLSHNSRYDRIERGEDSYTESELRGKVLFETEKGDCFHCHAAPRFGDDQFRNDGLDSLTDSVLTGRAAVTGLRSDNGKWKTPSLRNVAVTAPYMHDGRLPTLMDVLDHYNEHIVPYYTVDPLLLSRRSRTDRQLLTLQDKENLIAFLNCLTDSAFLNNPDLGPP